MKESKQSQRGMMKWAPYRALEDHQSFIDAAIAESQKIEKPILSDDDIEKINYSLKIYNHEKVTINFFENGAIKSITGIIYRIDSIYKSLMINRTKILFSNILSINYDETII